MEKLNKFEIENLTDVMLSEWIENKLNIEDVNNYLKRVEKSLNYLGISIHKNNNEFKPLGSIFSELANRWKSLDNTNKENEILKEYIATSIGGITKKVTFKSLMEIL